VTARATAAVLFCALGTMTAIAVTTASADPPIPGAAATVFRTVTEDQKYQGKGVRWWALHAQRNRRTINTLRSKDLRSRIVIRGLRRAVRARSAPTVNEALGLAQAVYGVDQRRRAYCESTDNPYAAEGHGPVGLLQFKPSTWQSTPFGRFSIWSPYAQALAGGWMVVHGRSSEWSCRL
jgi:Transglycosylase-like domain